jgi:hypothetical protein
MLNNIINAHIYQTNNEINRLNYLNKQKKTNNKEKYKTFTIDKKDFFKISSENIKLNNSLNNSQQDVNDAYIHDNQAHFNISDIVKTNYSFNNLRYNSKHPNKNFINNNIKKINNVYKINFRNAPTTGFGDFIRGCYFLLEFCDKLNIIVDFHIYDSNIKDYLKYFSLKPKINEKIANNIYKFTKINCSFTNNKGIINYNIVDNNDDFINYINNQYIYSNNIFINTVNFPSHFISQTHIDYMKTILEPTDLFKIEINNLMNKIGLNKNDYITYHIRLGDNFLENQFELIQNNKLEQIINKLDIDKDNNFLLISDSILIKNILTKKYLKIKTTENEAIHTGQTNNIDKIKNTLLDFYLMSNSKKIISFSIYPHGSGFSKWCAITYEIPYVCYALL